MANIRLQMKLIIWKNWRIRRNTWICLLFDILLPVLLLLVSLLLKFRLPGFKIEPIYKNETHFPTETVTNKLKVLYYTPDNEQTKKIMKDVKVSILSSGVDLLGFKTELLMNKGIFKLLEENSKDPSFADSVVGVIFNNIPENSLPRKLDYIIKARAPNFDISRMYSQIPFRSTEYLYYFSSNFFAVQQAVDLAFIKLHKSIDYSISYQQIPTPSYWDSDDKIQNIFCALLSFVIVYSYIFPGIRLVQCILQEKSVGMTELLKISGLKHWMVWCGWYIYMLIVIIPSVIIITVLIKYLLWVQSDAVILGLFFFMYCTSLTCFCFFISTLFNKALIGANVFMVVWIATFFPAFILLIYADPNSYISLRKLISVFPNSCIIYGLQTTSAFEMHGNGIHWSVLYQKHSTNYSMGILLLILFVESLLFVLLTCYISQIRPGEFGIRKPWNFCFKPKRPPESHDREPCPICYPADQRRQALDPLQSRNEFESTPAGVQAGIQIRDLHKMFNHTAAVNGLSCDIYSNQITVLLGHNGAGKTTTMNMITGMMEPTSGIILVDGYSIRSQIDKVRESLGFCPQHNVHFTYLTVQDHLIFFAMLKGMNKKEAIKASVVLMNQLRISRKARMKPATLSGGMKRRLSLGVALIGSTKTLILDEPTSGMDPETRREIWDILLKIRGSRTILITTHYMEEADILGDRIAIMHSGQLMCYGSTMFLKKFYGTGYTLSFLHGSKWNMDKSTETVKNFIPNATVNYISTGSVTFHLPVSDTVPLTRLFLTLDKTKDELGFSSYGVSLTTMDDVFIKVGRLADKTTSKEPDEDLSTSHGFTEDAAFKYNTGSTLLKQQFWALLVKRTQYHRHNGLLFFIAILLPLLMQVIALFSTHDFSSKEDLILNLGSYPSTISYYSSDSDKLASYYEKAVKQQKAEPVRTDQVSKRILMIGRENFDSYLHNFLTAAEIHSENNKINVMFGTYAIHSPTISLNLVTNTLLMHALNDETASITVRNNPVESKLPEVDSMVTLQWIILIPFGLIIFAEILLMFHVNERLTGVKHLQIMYGIPRYIYWLSNYIFDMFVYICVVLLMVILAVSFRDDVSHSAAIQAYILLLVLFGFAMFPFGYLFHYVSNVEKLLNYLSMIVVCCILLKDGLIIWGMFANGEEIDYIGTILIIFPFYALCDGLHRVLQHASQIHNWEASNQVTVCLQSPIPPCCVPDSAECKDFYNFYKGDYSLMLIVLFLLMNIVLTIAVFLILDYGYIRKYLNKNDKVDSREETLDSDIVIEKNRVTSEINASAIMASNSNDSDVLLVSNLRKSFGKFSAVKGLNFGVKASECFGLLGVNGAGKTTTFKMLTGEIFTTTGTVKLLGYFLMKEKRLYAKQIGYCPQFDALNFKLTTRELLTFFAHVRGIPKDKTQSYVNKWMDEFDIMKYQNVQADKLSGGNKRKISTAIALIGNPPVVMLDEPTCGVDPVARRNVWNILAAKKRTGQAIIITSHSMDECEALCDRLAIIVDGQMKCIGNIYYLKQKFGKGFTLAAKLKNVTTVQNQSGGAGIDFEKQVADLKSAIQHRFQCILKDEHIGMVTYHITDTTLTVGVIFEFMEKLKHTGEVVEDFTISDTSLEQIFLSFAKEQLEFKKKGK